MDTKEYPLQGNYQLMTVDEYFPFVAQEMKVQATYSKPRHAWVISRFRAQLILLDHMDRLHAPHASPPQLLEEGVRREVWDLDFDEQLGTRIVVLKVA
jgi:hypothetical protein